MNTSNRNEHISDASEWRLTQLPALSEMDILQRCFICKEFLKAPVIAPCNHTFCSQCIREYLLAHTLCPLCKSELFESNLKRDVLLEEIVTCYARIRPHLLKALAKPNTIEAAPTKPSPVSLSAADDDDLEIVQVITNEDDHLDRDCIPKRRKLDSISSRPSPDPTTAIPGRKDLVLCPICGEFMSAHTLQTVHIDQCLQGKKTKETTSRRPATSRAGITSFFQPVSSESTPKVSQRGRPSPVPNALPDDLGHNEHYLSSAPNTQQDQKLSRLDFLSLTTPKLKDKLAAVKIPTGGSRMQLELRYNQYYVLYNSNLDSSRPVLERELRQRLSQWERAHLAFAPVTANLFNPSTRSTISKRLIADKNFLILEWMDAYKDEFKHLIRAARQSAKKSRCTSTSLPGSPEKKQLGPETGEEKTSPNSTNKTFPQAHTQSPRSDTQSEPA